ncbi:MAG: MFS transporter [Promethearchaeota archaeon]|nr:MAG: MFS transporter [Candidatus Lokiarchaeota archaeon]
MSSINNQQDNGERNKNDAYLPFEPRMEPTAPDTLNSKRTIIISLSFLTVLLAWSYFNFKVPLLLNDILGDNPFKDIIKGSIMAMDNFVAVIIQPFFGDLSDRTRSKYGRRMPFIITGTVLAAIFFVLIPWMRILLGLILIIFLFDVAMSIFRGASIAILPDYTSDKMYSKASAIQQFVANMGGLIGFLIPIIIGFIPNLSVEWIDRLGFLIIGILMIALLAIQIIYIKETPTGEKGFKFTSKRIEIDRASFRAREVEDELEPGEAKKQKLKSYRDTVKIMKGHKDFAYFLMAVFFMYLAFASVEAFFSSFAMEYLGLYDAAYEQTGNQADAKKMAEAQASTLFLAYAGPMIASAFFVGMLGQSKRVGRKNAVKIFLIWMIISISIMSFVIAPIVYQNHQPFLMIVILMLISIPWMGFIVNSFPILWDLAPEGKVGIYTGIYYTFNQAAYTIAPILFGGILFLFIGFGDYRYIVMFPFVLFCVVMGLLLFSRVKGGETKED